MACIAFRNEGSDTCDQSQYGEIDIELLRVYSGVRQRQVVVIHAFLDESGTHPETPVLTVAGFYGCYSQWETFRNIWKPTIKDRQFHALDSDDLFPDLCAAIRHSAINGMFCTIGKQTYKTHASTHLKTFIGNSYSICAFLCALAICREIEPERASFVIEQGQPNVSFVKRILEDMMAIGEHCIAAVATARKADFIELHPADFVSHLASSHDKPWLQHLMDAGRLKHGHITEQMIKDAAPHVRELLRQARHARNKLRSV